MKRVPGEKKTQRMNAAVFSVLDEECVTLRRGDAGAPEARLEESW